MNSLEANRADWIIFSDSNLEFVREILAHVGNPNKPNFGGITLFHGAVNIPSDNIRVIRMLIDAGADVNLCTHLGFSPLHLAVIHQKQQVVEELIQSGALINAKNFLGRTSLHFAVSCLSYHCMLIGLHILPDPATIKRLLQHKDIDCNAVDFNGDTPLMIAIKDNLLQVALYLLMNNANPNICNNALETPLHVAFSLPRNQLEIPLLLEGASIYAVDKNGHTPFDILLNSGFSSRPNKWMTIILRIVAYRYNITNDLKRKFEVNPELSQILNKYCDEIDRMRKDFISDKITMHDFCLDCINETHFTSALLQIHKSVVERLVRDVYPEYFSFILNKIPESSLFTILQMTACTKNFMKTERKVKDITDLFSILDVTFLFSMYLSKVEVFFLIVALSDVINVEYMNKYYLNYLTKIKNYFNNFN